MEGYACKKLVDRAYNEGMCSETHWQDNDSSTSLVFKEMFPDIKLMLCGGHAGKSHLKLTLDGDQQLQIGSYNYTLSRL